MEQRLRSASNVDELMGLMYPSYWAALKCRSKLSAASAPKLSQHPQPRRLRPPADSEEMTFGAAYLNFDVLKSTFAIVSDIIQFNSYKHTRAADDQVNRWVEQCVCITCCHTAATFNKVQQQADIY